MKESSFEMPRFLKGITMPAVLIGISTFLSSCGGNKIDRDMLEKLSTQEGIAKLSVDKIHTVDSLLHDAGFIKTAGEAGADDMIEIKEGKVVITRDLGEPGDGIIHYTSVEDTKNGIIRIFAGNTGYNVDIETGVITAAKDGILEYVVDPANGPQGNFVPETGGADRALDEVIELSK
jgi:hypothetical protein